MPSVMITHTSKTEHSTFVQAVCDNTTATVSFAPSHGSVAVRVCVLNTSHRAFRIGAGKAFPNFDAAVAGYKSGAVKAIIEAARDAVSSTSRRLRPSRLHYRHQRPAPIPPNPKLPALPVGCDVDLTVVILQESP